MNEEQSSLHPSSRHVQSSSYSLRQPYNSLNPTTTTEQQYPHFYQLTPAPETVVVHSVPKKSKDACCWGCAAALCLCFGLQECCT
ncbi:MAG: hypothetical protein EXX96DRAFT_568643 [Benjaminiella poitrasii]|nr:MAG: hypothetical protein EXX96DRAFT_568643 [Benjaminiella poitrasii]